MIQNLSLYYRYKKSFQNITAKVKFVEQQDYAVYMDIEMRYFHIKHNMVFVEEFRKHLAPATGTK